MPCLVRMIKLGIPEAAWGVYWCTEIDWAYLPQTYVCTHALLTCMVRACVRTQAPILVKCRHKTEATQVCIHILLRPAGSLWHELLISRVPVSCCWLLLVCRGSEDSESLLIFTGHSCLLQNMGLLLSQLLLGFLLGWKCRTHTRDQQV